MNNRFYKNSAKSGDICGAHGMIEHFAEQGYSSIGCSFITFFYNLKNGKYLMYCYFKSNILQTIKFYRNCFIYKKE